jgi:hypothetical protein
MCLPVADGCAPGVLMQRAHCQCAVERQAVISTQAPVVLESTDYVLHVNVIHLVVLVLRCAGVTC